MSVETSSTVRATDAAAPVLLAGARIPGRDERVDVHVASGVTASIAPAGTAATTAGAERIELDGRFIVPGLHDRHVHFSQWSVWSRRLDLAGADSAAAAAA
ncbi:MAG TPA: amidohydrolase, partial [Agromyces sp.]|nr:amidohydrolase [Agromyces sp.]